jgi:hypothetical protein
MTSCWNQSKWLLATVGNYCDFRSGVKFPRWKFSPQHDKILTMDQYITYDVEYKVLICRQHKYAIPPDTILCHFRQSHKGIPLPTHQAISNYSKTVNLASPKDVAMPLVPVKAIKHLKMFNGFLSYIQGRYRHLYMSLTRPGGRLYPCGLAGN